MKWAFQLCRKELSKEKKKKKKLKVKTNLYICNAFIYQVKCIQIFLEIYFFYKKIIKEPFSQD